MPALSLHGAGGSAHHGLCRMADLAEDRLRLDRLDATAFQNFLPLSAAPPFLARQKSSGPAVLRCAAALKGALPLASGWSIAIEATVVAAREQHGDTTMANIGSFKKVGEGFEGEIVTLALQARNVRLVAETNRANDNAPNYRVYLGRVELGAAWTRRSNEGRTYLSLKLDDPSFAAPIFANLFTDEEGEGYTLIWTRPRSRNGD